MPSPWLQAGRNPTTGSLARTRSSTGQRKQPSQAHTLLTSNRATPATPTRPLVTSNSSATTSQESRVPRAGRARRRQLPEHPLSQGLRPAESGQERRGDRGLRVVLHPAARARPGTLQLRLRPDGTGPLRPRRTRVSDGSALGSRLRRGPQTPGGLPHETSSRRESSKSSGKHSISCESTLESTD